MDTANVPPAGRGPEKTLENRLQRVIGIQDLASQRELVQSVAGRLGVSLLDCAAALLYLHQPLPEPPAKNLSPKTDAAVKAHYRSVRYRLDVGAQHRVTKEHIQAVLVEESGVDKKRIGRIDIRHNYTLVELPDGMPADIFQLLSEATVGERKLAIKRVKSNNRRRPREAKDGE